ncbi:hypothetical protein DCC85_12230 [Paenibacillus sp. CAA11]|uniref:J domain-containing protein n=1 Tax=Paenibacillus sp. CAA11 TaxID=1532905 RepID=UPI000D34863E|nr:J domain-containing protein [Paenibacillus sp. CAA11]AWB44911.1 hypothetical protein DCC85_12230 [Paenibacillus sp. CAA11]
MINWSLLGIDPTHDKSRIKRAYADRLKIVHPEENPSGYQALREAYDAALEQARKFETDREEHTVQSCSNFQQTESDLPPSPSLSQDFWQKLMELYEDFDRRVDPMAWSAMAEHDYLWDINAQEQRFSKLMLFLQDHRYMPVEVWRVLDEMFLIRENFEQGHGHDDEWIEFVKAQIDGSLELGYDCFAAWPQHLDIEAYLELRQTGQRYLLQGWWSEAMDCLEQAHTLFSEDPDLELMRAKGFVMLGAADAALDTLNEVIVLNPNMREAYLMRGRLLFDQGQYIEALGDAEFLLEHHPKMRDALSLSLESRVALGQTSEAWKESSEYSELSASLFHFRYYAVMARLRNRHLFSQKENPRTPKERRKILRYKLLEALFLFLRLNWLYIFLYLILELTFDLHPSFGLVFLVVVLWNTWKTAKTTWRIFS